MPCIDDEHVVDEQARAIVDAQCEVPGSAIEVLRALPARGEVVVGDARIGRAGAPVEVDDVVVAGDGWVAVQAGIVPVIAAPIWE